jgi:hypothetical protein
VHSSSSKHERIESIRTWLRECESEHHECTLKIEKRHVLPKRLIETANSDAASPRLVFTENMETGSVRYAALSHCWGEYLPLRTTHKNESQLLQAIPDSQMPRTFSEALDICKSLCIRYLWIDALCILQDDTLEWQSESAKMNGIYSGAVLTIAAAGAYNGEEGCFPDNNAWRSRFTTPVAFKAEATGRELLVRLQKYDIKETVDDCILSSRGWVLQEQFLSPRIAYCLKDDLHWQCRSQYRTETGLVFPMTARLGDLNLPFSLQNTGRFRVWHRWMENYSSRNFSVNHDKLVAIVGIVEHCQKIWNDQPLLCMWKSSLIEDLLWFGAGDLPEPIPASVPGIPSWCWLGRLNDISYSFTEVDGSTEEMTTQYHTMVKECKVE